jgi:hypothetical protein
MRSSRRDYHYAIRHIKRNNVHFRKAKFSESLLKGGRQFYNEIKKYKGVKTLSSMYVNGCHGDENIAKCFANEYQSLFNTCNYDDDFYIKFDETISHEIGKCNESEQITVVDVSHIRKALTRIKLNKSDGVFTLVSDNFKNAPDILLEHLATLLNMCLIHGYLPECLILSTLIPIPKDKMGNLSCSQNYRGIALCTIILKIFEYVFLIKHGCNLRSSDHQFAYKENSSTTQCTWVAHETISYYNSNGSEVFACLLDCSKAFDKIRYDILFPKLIEKHISPIVIRLLFNNYINSKLKVRWCSSESDSFHVCNGVRQGAVLSPFLFNIYMDELIADLYSEGSGCWIGTQFYGALVYADDIMLLAPSVSGLQNMIKTCQQFGSRTGLDFNSKKTVCIRFHRNGDCTKSSSSPSLMLNREKLIWCDSVKHLGNTISCCNDFEKDICIKKVPLFHVSITF